MIRRTGIDPLLTAKVATTPTPSHPIEPTEAAGKIADLEKAQQKVLDQVGKVKEENTELKAQLKRALEQVEELQTKPEAAPAVLPTSVAVQIREVGEELAGDAVVVTGEASGTEIRLLLSGSYDVFRKLFQKVKQAPRG